MGVARCQRPLPVDLLPDVGAGAVQTIGPAVESAHERLPRPAERVLGAVGHIDQATAAVHADVVVGGEFVRASSYDDDRVVQDVVGEVAAHLGQLLDPADLLPDLAPQAIRSARAYSGEM